MSAHRGATIAPDSTASLLSGHCEYTRAYFFQLNVNDTECVPPSLCTAGNVMSDGILDVGMYASPLTEMRCVPLGRSEVRVASTKGV